MKLISVTLIVSALLAVTYATPTSSSADISPMADANTEDESGKTIKRQKCTLDAGDELAKKYKFVDLWNETKKTMEGIHTAAEKCSELKDAKEVEKCQDQQIALFNIELAKLLKEKLGNMKSISEDDLEAIKKGLRHDCVDSGSAIYQPFAASGAYFLSFYLIVQVLAYIQN